MHIHILGICGTFMGSLAVLAKNLGHTVTGSDANVYPPMSTQLEAQGISLMQGYDPSHLQPRPDLVIVGNAMKRGIPAVEYVLNEGIPYTSGPQWLAQYVLQGKHVIGVAGTHGKTTTTTMVAWILEQAGLEPGFLIGGVPMGFEASARLGGGKFFVVEADEYDSAFFDKRSKFIHYAPRTAILNNLEFDHADIFDDLAAIQKQFHHLVRTIPGQGRIIVPAADANLAETLAKGCWTPVEKTGLAGEAEALWQAALLSPDGSHFDVLHAGEKAGTVSWGMTGMHSVNNALSAIAAAHHVGVSIELACAGLSAFGGVKRRMELIGEVRGISVYDDFAHHPTAIKTTLEGLRKKVGNRRIWAVIEPRSNTMRMGTHKDGLAASASDADQVIWYQPDGLDWNLEPVIADSPVPAKVMRNIDAIVAELVAQTLDGDAVVIMSNGGFGGIHGKLVTALKG
ncbi:UDP-N-acetylmuramate: L-alanyl-gamma-D-glutamyl-meso-diaminopimelate ligase [Fluviicoccus keumensis]|uniref:UDP-N-acetylmuramate--L-alanyl-gamma-D-glutamyl-meso-2,6-diaminoheptandioate ligase n=1 Tax=Fluviicoccus keumensis TaxID=1435465 RepID=A0A4Q7YIK5_9GAMM|nr:UDP-N-acetylmuramate:L-alanyl-gamma-D-glutamyl-meso-diaminopimelate ligase [Fluviicoccus keumensis]RZU36968.1 UDP-N-acetylmuramate: L-alanyl-gamma-D-glutamyl-meso-diaminopimelate ligase [Fluviicoccus keumensis]